jgi:hypothetical protein
VTIQIPVGAARQPERCRQPARARRDQSAEMKARSERLYSSTALFPRLATSSVPGGREEHLSRVGKSRPNPRQPACRPGRRCGQLNHAVGIRAGDQDATVAA